MEEDLFGDYSEQEEIVDESEQEESEEEFEQDISEEEREEEAEEEAERALALEVERALEEEAEEKTPEEILGTKKDDEEILAEEQAERQARKLQALGYDVEIIPVGVGIDPGAGKQRKPSETGRLYLSAAERKKQGLPPIEKGKGKVVTERVSTNRAKQAAKRRGGIRVAVGKAERTKYGAKRIGTVRLVGTHIEEPVDVYTYEEKPYERLVGLLKRWSERYAAKPEPGAPVVGKPPSRASIPTISRVIKDEKKSKTKVVYDIPITYREFAVLQKRSESIQKILDEVRAQRKKLIRESIPEGGRLKFPAPEERVSLSAKEREKMDKLERQIFEAAEEVRRTIAPRTEAGTFLVAKLEDINKRRKKAEKISSSSGREEALLALDLEENDARNEAVVMRIKLASTMGIAPKKRSTILLAEKRSPKKRQRSEAPKQSQFQYKAWRAAKRPSQKTRNIAVKVLSLVLDDSDAKRVEKDIYANFSSNAYFRRLALAYLLSNDLSNISRASKAYAQDYSIEDLGILSEQELVPELLHGESALRFSDFLRRYSGKTSELIFSIENGEERVSAFKDLPDDRQFSDVSGQGSEFRSWLSTKRPNPDTRTVIREIFGDIIPKYSLEEFEDAVYEATKTSVGYDTKDYLRRVGLLALLLTSKPMKEKSPFLEKKLSSGFYELGALALTPEEELVPEFLLDKKLKKSFAKFLGNYSPQFSEFVYDVVRGSASISDFWKLPDGGDLEKPPKLQSKCVNPDASKIPLGSIVMCFSKGKFYCFDAEKEIKTFVRTGKFKNPYTGQKLPEDFIRKIKYRYGGGQ